MAKEKDQFYLYGLIDWHSLVDNNPTYNRMTFSVDQQLAMSNYLFLGLEPGGHISAMIARDYERAMFNADIHSRTNIWATANFILNFFPEQAQGSYEAIKFWCNNQKLRDDFRVECEKMKMWNILKEPNEQ